MAASARALARSTAARLMQSAENSRPSGPEREVRKRQSSADHDCPGSSSRYATTSMLKPSWRQNAAHDDAGRLASLQRRPAPEEQRRAAIGRQRALAAVVARPAGRQRRIVGEQRGAGGAARHGASLWKAEDAARGEQRPNGPAPIRTGLSRWRWPWPAWVWRWLAQGRRRAVGRDSITGKRGRINVRRCSVVS